MSRREISFFTQKCIYLALVVAVIGDEAVVQKEDNVIGEWSLITCFVDGEIYDNDFNGFSKHSKQECFCQRDYKSGNINKICESLKSEDCEMYVDSNSFVQQMCIPVYEDKHDFQIGCISSYLCPKAHDLVVHQHHPSDKIACSGRWEMHPSDVLYRYSRHENKCTICFCNTSFRAICVREHGKCHNIIKQNSFNRYNYD